MDWISQASEQTGDVSAKSESEHLELSVEVIPDSEVSLFQDDPGDIREPLWFFKWGSKPANPSLQDLLDAVTGSRGWSNDEFARNLTDQWRDPVVVGLGNSPPVLYLVRGRFVAASWKSRGQFVNEAFMDIPDLINAMPEFFERVNEERIDLDFVILGGPET